MYSKSLEIDIRVHGDSHPLVADSFNKIGAVYERKVDLENALVHLQNSLEMDLKLLGSEHPLVADSSNNVGLVYQKKGLFSTKRPVRS